MASFDDLTAQFTKDFGKIGGKGYAYTEIERIPTGLFPLDLATGGGLPQGKFIEIFGKESSCKSVVLYKTIANAQKMYPKKKHGLFDIEKAFDPKWFKRLGGDPESLYVFDADYGEAMIDMAEGLIGSKECGILGFDSIAAIVTTRELEQSAEKNDVGGGGLLASKLIRKVVAALGRANKAGYMPTIIALNQIRNKIGGYGDPTTTPGGNAPKFAASMRIQLYGKDHVDAKYHDSLPVAKEVNFKIVKHKVPIVAKTGDMFIVMVPHKGLKPGDCDDFKIFQAYMEKHKLLEKTKDGYQVGGKDYKTLRVLRDTLNADIKTAMTIKGAIIEAEKDAANRDDEAPYDPDTGEILEDAPKEEKKVKGKAKGKKNGSAKPVLEEVESE